MVLFLSEEDVAGLLTMKEAIEVVEYVFREKGEGKVQMPSKTYVSLERYKGDFRVMPAYLYEMDVAGVKVVNVHPENPDISGLPAVMATIILLDPRNGSPLSIMGGARITSFRTGAAGGVATKYLARRDSSTIGVVGAGVQARTQLWALNEVLDKIEEVRVTSKRRRSMERFAKEMEERVHARILPVDTVERTVKGADVVITVTPVRSPIVRDEWIGAGTHINAIGADAPGKQELSPELLKRAKIVVDDWEQASGSGEINVPLRSGIISEDDVYGELGDIVCGRKAGRVSDEEITIFDSTGLAIQDVATAWMVFKKAKRSGSGRSIELFRQT